MRKPALLIGGAVLAAAGYFSYLAYDAGEFRSVVDMHPGECRKIRGTPGPEDITLHPHLPVALISSFDRRAALTGEIRPGGIFAWALDGSMKSPVNLTPDVDVDFRPHGISLFVDGDGRSTLLVVNHPGESLFGDQPDSAAPAPAHTVEVFELQNMRLVHRETLSHDLMVSPNDIVAVDHRRFYFTNDHGSAPGGNGRWKTISGWAGPTSCISTAPNFARLPRASATPTASTCLQTAAACTSPRSRTVGCANTPAMSVPDHWKSGVCSTSVSASTTSRSIRIPTN